MEISKGVVRTLQTVVIIDSFLIRIMWYTIQSFLFCEIVSFQCHNVQCPSSHIMSTLDPVITLSNLVLGSSIFLYKQGILALCYLPMQAVEIDTSCR